MISRNTQSEEYEIRLMILFGAILFVEGKGWGSFFQHETWCIVHRGWANETELREVIYFIYLFICKIT